VIDCLGAEGSHRIAASAAMYPQPNGDFDSEYSISADIRLCHATIQLFSQSRMLLFINSYTGALVPVFEHESIAATAVSR